MTSMNMDYSERIVSFVDILGFKALIQNLESDSDLHMRLHWALSHIKSFKTNSLTAGNAHSDLEVSVFSDCIVITCKYSPETDAFHGVIWASGWLQAQLLGVGILTRGGISVGKTHHSDDILYGQGMLNAYQIEKSAAVFPRIALDPKVSNIIPENYKSTFLGLDADGLWFIDPFSFPVMAGNSDALIEDGWDPHEIFLHELGKHIETGISVAKKVEHQSKWVWLQRRYESARDKYIQSRETKLSLLMKLK